MKDLVSIIVITYNSSKYIIETLDSIKKQTYTNIELIISDDHSIDDTIIRVKKWLNSNSQLFKYFRIIESPKNTGISSNCNRGISYATGKYVKLIAGDDMLTPDCVEKNITFIKKSHASIVFSKIIFLSVINNKNEIDKMQKYHSDFINFFNLPDYKQKEYIIKKNYLMAPSAFFNHDTLKQLGGFDENYLMEDYPLWIKAFTHNVKINFLDNDTIIYRLHEAQATRNNKHQYREWFFLDEYRIFKNIRKPHLSFIDKWDEYIRFLIGFIVIRLGNKKSIYNIMKFLFLLSLKRWLKLFSSINLL